MLDELRTDFVMAVRRVLRTPFASLVIVLSLGLALGANSTLITWIDNLILDPYPLVRDPARLVALNATNVDGTAARAPPISYATLLEWQRNTRSFTGISAVALIHPGFRLQDRDVATPIWGQLVTHDYFNIVGVSPALGRALTAADESNRVPVVVLSNAFWRRAFGADPHVVGRHILLNNLDTLVIGVMPAGFFGVDVGLGFDVWLSVTLQPLINPGVNSVDDRNARWLQPLARLAPNATVASASRELDALARRLSAANGESPPTGAVVRAMRERFLGAILVPLFSALFIVTAVVLLLACANAANLLLARALARQKQFAIQLALGASRGKLVRELLTESAVFALLAGSVAIGFAVATYKLFLRFVPPTSQPVLLDLHVNQRVIALTLGLTVLTVLLFGLIPALRTTHVAPATVLKEGGTQLSGKARFRDSLIAVQVALATLTLVCAALFTQSLVRARALDLGFSDPGSVLLASVDLAAAGYQEPEAGAIAFEQLLARIRDMPGANAATASNALPLGFGGHVAADTRVEGYQGVSPSESIERVIVATSYFETLGTRITQGRTFEPEDDMTRPRVAMVNAEFARRYWPDKDPIGRRFEQGQGWVTVIGVVADVVFRDLGDPPYPIVYMPHAQWYTPTLTLQVRTTHGDPRALERPLRELCAAINSRMSLSNVRSMTDHLRAATFVQELGSGVLSALGAMATLLAGIGVYGIVIFSVQRRRQTTAILLALGAPPSAIRREIVFRALRTTAVGVLVGCGLALALAVMARRQLIGVAPYDPFAYLTVALFLFIVAVGASWIPAQSASRADPADALKSA